MKFCPGSICVIYRNNKPCLRPANISGKYNKEWKFKEVLDTVESSVRTCIGLKSLFVWPRQKEYSLIPLKCVNYKPTQTISAQAYQSTTWFLNSTDCSMQKSRHASTYAIAVYDLNAQ